jgi:hypothetical protein
MQRKPTESSTRDTRPRGFVLRAPWAIVDTAVFARLVRDRNPAWRELERYSGPLPPKAVEALELANEVLGKRPE